MLLLMENLSAYISDKLTNELLEFVNNLIIQEYSFEEKIRNLCTKIDRIHHTYTTFTYVNEKQIKYLISRRFECGLQERDDLLSDEVRLAYWELLREHNEISWHYLKSSLLHRDAYYNAVENGCNAHYYIPVYTVKNCPIGYFICFYEQTKKEHVNIKSLFTEIEKIVQILFKMEMYQQQIKQLTLIDATTELPSYQQFITMLERYKAQNKIGVIKIVMLGEFSKITELYGRPAGEKVLKELGKRLIKLSSSENSNIARYKCGTNHVYTC